MPLLRFFMQALVAVFATTHVHAQIDRDSSNAKIPYEVIVLKSSTKRQTLSTSLNISNRSGHFLLFDCPKFEVRGKKQSPLLCLTKGQQVIPPGEDQDLDVSFDVGADSSNVQLNCQRVMISTEAVGTFEPFRLLLDFGKGYVSGPLYLYIKDVVIKKGFLRISLQISYTGPNLLTMHFRQVKLVSDDFGIHANLVMAPSKQYCTPGEKAEVFHLEFPIPQNFNPTQKTWLEFVGVFEELGLGNYPGCRLFIYRGEKNHWK